MVRGKRVELIGGAILHLVQLRAIFTNKPNIPAMWLTNVAPKGLRNSATTTTTQVPNHLPEQSKILGYRLLHREDSTTIRWILVEHEGVHCLPIHQRNICNAMKTCELTNPIEHGTICWRVDGGLRLKPQFIVRAMALCRGLAGGLRNRLSGE